MKNKNRKTEMQEKINTKKSKTKNRNTKNKCKNIQKKDKNIIILQHFKSLNVLVYSFSQG